MSITEKQLRAIADRCETAKHKRCKCRCGGELHGIYHSDEWVETEVIKDRVRRHRPPGQLDWIGYQGYERYL